MSEKRGWGKTVMGWFVESDEHRDPTAPSEPASGGADAADALIAKYAGGGAPVEAPPVELKGPLPPIVSGKIDFSAVYEAAGVDQEERDRIKKAQDLLRSLPAETPIALKRQIVEASLKAFGVPTEKIIEASVQGIEALESFIRAGQAETQTLLSEGASKIAELEAEIAEVRKIMQEKIAEQEERTRASNAEKLGIQDVLEFFGQDAVAKVVEASPKLHTPPG
ncbi:hypothetical protein L6R52_30835 [Myxococcota bacterium]|nr:hypothetical protein [Myxococcota bacterium]